MAACGELSSPDDAELTTEIRPLTFRVLSLDCLDSFHLRTLVGCVGTWLLWIFELWRLGQAQLVTALAREVLQVE